MTRGRHTNHVFVASYDGAPPAKSSTTLTADRGSTGLRTRSHSLEVQDLLRRLAFCNERLLDLGGRGIDL